jgi:hypothetical protein
MFPSFNFRDFQGQSERSRDQPRESVEQGRCRPLGGNRAYLMIIDRAPKEVIEILRAKVRNAA